MKPAGIERDKRIAEMCGDMGCHFYFLGNCGKSLDCYCSEYKPKPYSTDISCAMELDMPDHDIWMRQSGRGYWAGVTLNPLVAKPINFIGEFHETQASALADARSGAWLRWREADVPSRI